MKTLRLESTVALAILLVCGAGVTARAQKITGDITGTVTDTTGAVLPGVVVNAVCPSTNFTRTATTDERGGFSLPELPVKRSVKAMWCASTPNLSLCRQ